MKNGNWHVYILLSWNTSFQNLFIFVLNTPLENHKRILGIIAFLVANIYVIDISLNEIYLR